MLPKRHRLLRCDFKHVTRSRGGVFHGKYLNVRIVPATDRSEKKISFVASKKVAKRAVERNRLRRIGYRCVANMIDTMKAGYFTVFYFTPSALHASEEAICREIQSLVMRPFQHDS